MALAIDREALLDAHFRAGIKEPLHAALNGPYPAGSWACDPTLVSRRDKASLDPFDAELARARWKEGKEAAGGSLELKLKYATGDEATAEAMRDLCARVSKELPGVNLVAEGVGPHQLRVDVEESSNYDLAYYHYDFPEGAFWLWPLLGSSDKGTENFLHYDGPLLAQVQRASALRYFPEVQRLARTIHVRMLTEEMPFIPLWQLDPIYAVRPGAVVAPPFDPHQPFVRAGEWRVVN